MYQCSHVRGWAALWLYCLVTASTCGDVGMPALVPDLSQCCLRMAHAHLFVCLSCLSTYTLQSGHDCSHVCSVPGLLCSSMALASAMSNSCPYMVAWACLVWSSASTWHHLQACSHTPAVSQLHRLTWATLFPCLPCASGTMWRLGTSVHSSKMSQLCQASVWASLFAHRLHPSTDMWH